MARIAVAMSGGVDSAVAAALLVREGHEVIGLTMNLWPTWLSEPDAGHRTCCGVTAVEDARAAARALGIRHYVLNLREAFERAVIDYFCDEYARGRTPNPCVACNQEIKFRVLLETVDGLGCAALATGHYARVARDPASGRYVLLRAADPAKDQSYVLYGLTQDQLARVRFPVGDYTKPAIRALAREAGLPVADKPDSQEICFIPAGHYGDLVAARRPDAVRPGPIVDLAGRTVGTHRGIARYTVGQRRGLGVATGAPVYVLAVDAPGNRLVVGPAGALAWRGVRVGRVNWIVPPPLPSAVTARLRHAAADVPVTLAVQSDGTVDVWFTTPQRAAAPGQAVAFYEGIRVLGGGIIERELQDEEETGHEHPH
ncbi:MAG: tRNA 2-thiouridine(34) synthase MnmA [Armatimonadota bacterium]|nr:tRNA 2-thiouridine(34) synthase MnmA [Armatimonadota bacterium]MDR7532374.1 tRNA 2-thiouridine(34) synthase MnmA [Armatimonadota bacterium]MDR7535301.1 tRNA 2-thiouridine(34) synthase MnmA [Armatimonadota bacterium]